MVTYPRQRRRRRHYAPTPQKSGVTSAIIKALVFLWLLSMGFGLLIALAIGLAG